MTTEEDRRAMTKQYAIKNLLVFFPLSSLLVSIVTAEGQTDLPTTTIATMSTTTATTDITPTTTFRDDTGFTVKLPPGWTAVDLNNTDQQPEEATFMAATDYNLLELCPPGQSVLSENDPYPNKPGCRGYFGSIQVQRYLNLDNEKSFVSYANSSVDPKTGLKVLNITTYDIIEYTKDPWDILLDTKDMLVNITDVNDGTHWQVPGKLALFSTIDEKLKYIGLYFVMEGLYNNNTAGYRVTYSAPAGAEADPSLMWEPRGDPIPIYGIDLDNLPPSFDPIMRILESVSIYYTPARSMG
jgi:hypothetical protein